MKKRGFTLIELLAVIIILAIIALIATPIIMRVIENSKKGAAERGAENYIREVETIVLALKANGTTLEDGIYKIKQNGNICPDQSTDCSEENEIKIGMKGTKPDKGNIKIIESKVDSYAVMIGDYDFSKDMLPFTYQQVEYIESAGTDKQYIDTGYSVNIDTVIKCDITPISGTNLSCLYGIYEADKFITAWVTDNRSSNQRFGSKSVSVPIQVGENHNIQHSSEAFIIDGVTYSYENQNNFLSDNTLYIFRANDFGTPIKAKLYSFEILENDSTKYNFVPCYSTTTVTDVNGKECKEGTIGLYDLVSKKFYTNQGSGTFTAGPDVN